MKIGLSSRRFSIWNVQLEEIENRPSRSRQIDVAIPNPIYRKNWFLIGCEMLYV